MNLLFPKSTSILRELSATKLREGSAKEVCIGRHIRRAWLWGEDRVSGRNYEHRKSWVTACLAELADVFTIDVCAYAVMSNQYHLVTAQCGKSPCFGKYEVIARYGRLFKMPVLVERYRQQNVLFSPNPKTP